MHGYISSYLMVNALQCSIFSFQEYVRGYFYLYVVIVLYIYNIEIFLCLKRCSLCILFDLLLCLY